MTLAPESSAAQPSVARTDVSRATSGLYASFTLG
jgi:hypothetical protein